MLYRTLMGHLEYLRKNGPSFGPNLCCGSNGIQLVYGDVTESLEPYNFTSVNKKDIDLALSVMSKAPVKTKSADQIQRHLDSENSALNTNFLGCHERFQTYLRASILTPPHAIDQMYTDAVFSRYVKIMAEFSPHIANCISQLPPTRHRPYFFICSSNAIVTYFHMCLARALWYNPIYVHMMVYLRSQGMSASEALMACQFMWADKSLSPLLLSEGGKRLVYMSSTLFVPYPTNLWFRPYILNLLDDIHQMRASYHTYQVYNQLVDKALHQQLEKLNREHANNWRKSEIEYNKFIAKHPYEQDLYLVWSRTAAEPLSPKWVKQFKGFLNQHYRGEFAPNLPESASRHATYPPIPAV